MNGALMIASAASTLASVAATATAGAAATSSAIASSAPATSPLQSLVTSVVPSLLASALPAGITTTTPVTEARIFLPVSFEVAAILAGALAGGIVAVRRGFDILGVMTLALVSGLGGGIIRDLLLQKHGIFALDNPRALVAVLVGALIATFFLSAATRLRPVLLVVDTLSLGLFCLVGSDKALVAGLAAIPAILLGTITATGGGVLRDLMCDREPEILRRGSLYSTAALAGSTTYVVMATWLNITKPIALVSAALLAIGLRLGSVWFGWESPEPVDLTGRVSRMPARAWQASSGLLRARRHDERDREKRARRDAEERTRKNAEEDENGAL